MSNVHPKSSSKMKYPFGLTHKPITHPFTNGQVRFKMADGNIHYKIILIQKSIRHPILKGMIADKNQLEYLTTIKQFPIESQKLGLEQPLLTEVTS